MSPCPAHPVAMEDPPPGAGLSAPWTKWLSEPRSDVLLSLHSDPLQASGGTPGKLRSCAEARAGWPWTASCAGTWQVGTPVHLELPRLTWRAGGHTAGLGGRLRCSGSHGHSPQRLATGSASAAVPALAKISGHCTSACTPFLHVRGPASPAGQGRVRTPLPWIWQHAGRCCLCMNPSQPAPWRAPMQLSTAPAPASTAVSVPELPAGLEVSRALPLGNLTWRFAQCGLCSS